MRKDILLKEDAFFMSRRQHLEVLIKSEGLGS